jgi:hypothetical protein
MDAGGCWQEVLHLHRDLDRVENPLEGAAGCYVPGTSRGALLVLAVTTTALAVASLVGELAVPSAAEHVVAGAALTAVFVAVILVYFMARRG